MKCSVIGCDEEATIRTEEEKFLGCCPEHLDEFEDHLEEQRSIVEQIELENWIMTDWYGL